MERTNIYILNIGNATATSGVDRYLENLLINMKVEEGFHIYKIELMRDNSHLFYEQKINGGYTEITIPFPVECNEIINEKYWIRKYNEYVFYLIKDLFKHESLSILHIHTLNLIDLALYIRMQIPSCKIITHLHCIPWKNFFNKNKKRFNTLYTDYYLSKKGMISKEYYLTNNCEFDSYASSDKIIAVTDCAKEFLIKKMEISSNKIHVITNGLSDNNNDSDILKQQKNKDNIFNCLYAGVLTESKGILYILESLRKIQSRGYKVNLNIAGAYNDSMRKTIEENFYDLNINLLGRISFEQLKKHYLSSDVGLIASLQEQCSYVAIEMAMFGLPIIVTAVDGLDEMFEDKSNALKVNTIFSKVFGLKVDTDMFADKIVSLIENPDLRKELGKNARKLYKEKFTSEHMIKETIEVYKKMIYE